MAVDRKIWNHSKFEVIKNNLKLYWLLHGLLLCIIDCLLEPKIPKSWHGFIGSLAYWFIGYCFLVRLHTGPFRHPTVRHRLSTSQRVGTGCHSFGSTIQCHPERFNTIQYHPMPYFWMIFLMIFKILNDFWWFLNDYIIYINGFDCFWMLFNDFFF